jgi:hypothetical protein
LNVKANGEIISPIITSRDATILAPPVKLDQSRPSRAARFAGISWASRATFFRDFDIETIVARQFEYSVSHFIDCLAASLNITCSHMKLERRLVWMRLHTNPKCADGLAARAWRCSES